MYATTPISSGGPLSAVINFNTMDIPSTTITREFTTYADITFTATTGSRLLLKVYNGYRFADDAE
jgi:hypothetical protein